MSWNLHHLFRDHARALVSTLQRRGASRDLAEDIAQDTFLRALQLPGDPAGIVNPRAFLTAVSRNLFRDFKRAERLRATEALTDMIADPAPGAETVVHDRERLAITARALAALPDRTRRAFELHRLHGLTIAEVAATLDLSVSRTWTLIHDAYRHIRRCLAEADGDGGGPGS